jgi:hypothetical protein
MRRVLDRPQPRHGRPGLDSSTTQSSNTTIAESPVAFQDRRPPASHFQAKDGPDQHECRGLSVAPGESSTEKPRQSRRSRHTCRGVTLILRQGHRVKAAWQPDRTWDCPGCRVWLVQTRVEHYTACAGDRPLVVRRLASSSWPSAQRALNRAGAQYVRVPQPDGMVLVIATTGPGAPVADLWALLTRALAAKPTGARVTSSPDWAYSSAPRAAAAPWLVIGVSPRRIAEVVAAAQRLHLYLRPLPGLLEAHELTALTAELRFEIGMRWTDLEQRFVTRSRWAA